MTDFEKMARELWDRFLYWSNTIEDDEAGMAGLQAALRTLHNEALDEAAGIVASYHEGMTSKASIDLTDAIRAKKAGI